MLPVWRFFLRKRQFTLLLMVGLLVWGVASVIKITKESAPEVQIPVGVVSVGFPGASPDEVEKLITTKIEDRLINLQNLNKLTSTSREGFATVVAEFSASADLKDSIQKLKDEVDKVRPDLPEDATDPTVSDVNFVDQPIQIIAVTADAAFSNFAALAERLKSELQSLPGVSRVEVSGVRDREITVVVRKEDLARYSIGLNEVVGAIAASNASLPVGSIEVDGVTYNVRFEGNLDQVTEIGDIALTSIRGQTIYLRDIALVSDGVERAQTFTRVSVGGAPAEQALSLSIFKSRGIDVTDTSSRVRERLEELKNSLLLGSNVVIVYDTGDQVNEDLGRLTRAGLETTTLVLIVLFITIGWREAIAAALSIPLSFLIAFIGLFYSGNTINFVSLFSLILAIGILVDSGIVVTEAIHTRLKLYPSRVQAALAALKEYAWPLITGTLTTVAVFVPLFFISGIVGKFIASIPFTVIFVLIASIFVALGLVPLITIMLIKENGNRLTRVQEAYTARAQAWYKEQLRRLFANRRWHWRIIGLMTLGFVASLLLPITGLLKVEFFPAEDIDFITIDIEKPEGTTLAHTDLATRAVEELLYEDARVASFITTIGSANAFGGGANGAASGAKLANITVKLHDKSTSEQIVEDLKRGVAPITNATVRVSRPAGGPPVGAPILIKFLGNDRDGLARSVAAAETTLRSIEGVTDVITSTRTDSTEYVLHISRDKLVSLGLTPISIAQTLRTAISGTKATTIRSGVKDADVVVSLNVNPSFGDPHDTNVTTIDAVRQIPIKTPSGSTILLGSVVETSIGYANSIINHEGRERTGTVSAQILAGYNAIELTREFTERFADYELPEGIRMVVGGENEETNQSFAEMFYALIAGLVLMYAIVLLEFNSFRLTAYLLITVPLSLIGVFLGLALTFQPLSFPSLLGVIALAGVIINNAIILLDAVLLRLRENPERPWEDIVAEASVSRLRPIILTTVTTVIAMIPLTYSSALWGPLAFAVMFGLSFATILTLIFIPMLVYRWPGKITRLLEWE